MGFILNQVIINLSLIVSTVLTCYFGGIRNATKRKTHTHKHSTDSLFLNRLKIGFFGISIGIAALFLSSNAIVISPFVSVDMRYVVIFFTVIYGSIYLGSIVTSVLIVGKSIEYSFVSNQVPLTYLNNVILTLFLFIVCVLIKKNYKSLTAAIFYFMVVFFITRVMIFSIYFAPIFETQKLLNILIYFVVFNLIFLATVLITNMAVSVESAMNLYRTGSVTDDLTKLYNRRMFTNDLNAAFRIQNKSNTFCLAILDIDNFKTINDLYGHHTGDLVLTHFTTMLKEELSPENGEVYRIGGEEFAFLTFLSLKEAIDCLEAFRQKLNNTPYQINEETIISISTSIGLTEFDYTLDHEDGSTTLYTRADRALYEAKGTGKDKLTIF